MRKGYADIGGEVVDSARMIGATKVEVEPAEEVHLRSDIHKLGNVLVLRKTA